MPQSPQEKHLQKELNKLRAEFDQLHRAFDHVVHERNGAVQRVEHLEQALAISKANYRELHIDHQETKECLDELIQKLGNKNEFVNSLLRRLYGTSRERHDPDQELIGPVADLIANPEAYEAACPYDQDGDQCCRHADCDNDCATRQDSNQYAVGFQDCDDCDISDRRLPGINTFAKKPTTRKRPAGTGGRGAIPDCLPKVYETYTAGENHPALQGVDTVSIIGQREIPKIDIAPIEWQVLYLTCSVARITKGGCTYQATLAPPSVLPQGQATDRAIIHGVIDKHADHLPHYRQEKRARRNGLKLHRSKLCRWEQALAATVTVVYEEQLAALMCEPCIGIDDTVMRRLDIGAGTGKCAQGRLWAVSGQAGYYYMATETREAKWISSLLVDYQGAVMGDGCSSHNPLLARSDILGLFCWAHVRRYFYDAEASPQCAHMLDLIQQLYRVEDELAEEPPAGKIFKRQAYAGPILDVIHEYLENWQEDKRVLPASGLGKAVNYALNRWDGLTAYAHLGHAPIDNNHTERAMRPNALTRKNSLFHASEEGSQAYAILQTLIQSALLYDLDPEEYLNDITQALHYKSHDPAELIPSRWAAMRDEAEGYIEDGDSLTAML